MTKIEEIEEKYTEFIDNEILSTFLKDVGFLLTEVTRLQALVDDGVKLSQELLDFSSEGWAYADKYFKDKWNAEPEAKEYEDRINRLKAAKGE